MDGYFTVMPSINLRVLGMEAFMSVNSYGNESITALKGAERVRLRPEALLGSKGVDGARHTVYEIIGNASDEMLAGYGDKLDIQLYEDGSISVRDYGRGVPLGWNSKENNWNYYLIYEELYAGGKYENHQELLRQVTDWDNFKVTDIPYLFKVGLNGLGASATQCTSRYTTVTSYRGGKSYTMEYRDGAHVLDKLIEEPTSEPDGTFVHWLPDDRVFSEVDLGVKWVEKLCQNLSYVSGFNVTLTRSDGKVKEYKRSSIKEAMLADTGECVEGSNFTHTTDSVGDVCISFCDVAIGKYGRSNEYFNNKIAVRGGVHSEAVNSALYEFFAGRVSAEGIRMSASDYHNSFSVIVSTLCNKVSYRGQTKDSLDDRYVFACIYECILNTLEKEYSKGTRWIREVVDTVIQNAKNRIAVAELSKNLKEAERASRQGKTSDKFISCDTYGKSPEETEFWIVEGDSAGGAFKEARDSKYMCFLKIRGKSLNVYKSTIDRLLANREIKDIISALGTGVDLGIEGLESFDASKLRVGKVIFASDADIDGLHIRLLLFTIFFKLFPQLLYDGRIYVAVPPLYVLSLRNNTFVYCMDEEDRDKKIAEYGSSNIKEVLRFKGLGEMNPKQLWDTTINPATRRLIQIKIDKDDTDVYNVLECLFGKSTDRRKKAILGSMLGDDYDSMMESIEDFIEYINSLDLSEVEYEDIPVYA